MVRYIILRKHLLPIPPIIAFFVTNRHPHGFYDARVISTTPKTNTQVTLAPCQPPPTARTEEEEREKFNDFEKMEPANSTIIQNCDTVRVGHAIRLLKKIKTSPSNTSPFERRLLSQNVNGLGGDNKLNKLVETMIQRNRAGFCVQET